MVLGEGRVSHLFEKHVVSDWGDSRLELDCFQSAPRTLYLTTAVDLFDREEVVALDLAAAEKLAAALIVFIRNHPDVKGYADTAEEVTK